MIERLSSYNSLKLFLTSHNSTTFLAKSTAPLPPSTYAVDKLNSSLFSIQNCLTLSISSSLCVSNLFKATITLTPYYFKL